MTLFAGDQPALSPKPDELSHEQDPFISPSKNSTHYRFSHFDNHSLHFSPSTSPGQAKRALAAHLAETEKRIDEASKLGTTLLQQRKDLVERLDDVEKQQAEDEISPELRKKLVEIEKEYNQVGRDSARVFLSKPRVSSKDIAGSPFGDAKHSMSPLKEHFETTGVGSPSKLGIKNRRQRNQPLNRVHDIEFATEISTSLLSQVRHLQALLAEKEEQYKAVSLEKSRLEVEAESFTERLRSLNESGERYKDENWSLETQIHEFMAKDKEAADRERRLIQNLNLVEAEKSAAQKELDEVKSNYAKLSEEHSAVSKHYEVELASLRRSLTSSETEKSIIQRKNEELRGQNQELAKAIVNHRSGSDDRDQTRGLGDEDLEMLSDDVNSEYSPPVSPVKGTPRHGMLESETLKSSLNHAHRMIQNLKSNIHREKTEKLELKRLLQDARDELESRRVDIGPTNGKKSRKNEAKDHKKSLKPAHLGGMRSTKTEIYNDDPNWEDDSGQMSPSHAAAKSARIVSTRVVASEFINSGVSVAIPNESSDQFETANEIETSDAFESANERLKDSDNIQIGDEENSEGLTEKESGSAQARKSRSSFSSAGNRQSFHSTAPTSDEDQYIETTSNSAIQSSRSRLKFGRNSNRRSRRASEEPQSRGSPASLANTSRNTTPQAVGQSLFAELGDLDGSDEDSIIETPIPSRYVSRSVTPILKPGIIKYSLPPPPAYPKFSMKDAGTMTDFLDRISQETPTTSPSSRVTKLINETEPENSPVVLPMNSSVATQITSMIQTVDVSSQYHEEEALDSMKEKLDLKSTLINNAVNVEHASEDVLDENIAELPSPQISCVYPPNHKLETISHPGQPLLTFSTIFSENLEPLHPDNVEHLNSPENLIVSHSPIPESLVLSTIQSVQIEPEKPEEISSLKKNIAISRSENASKDSTQSSGSALPISFGSSFNVKKAFRPSKVISTENRPLGFSISKSRDIPRTSTSQSQQRSKNISTMDGSTQTALTADQVDEMLNKKKRESPILDDGLTVLSTRMSQSTRSTSHSRKSIEGNENSIAISSIRDLGYGTTLEKMPTRTSSRINFQSGHPQHHSEQKEVISAPNRRSGSSSEGIGSMPPPLPPRSTQPPSKTTISKTSSAFVSRSSSTKDESYVRTKNPSAATESRAPSQNKVSRVSSVSSFASEVDLRFQLNNESRASAQTQSGTDPRMINAITQTMIGEYLWKYTRKTGRGAMSERRHRRYFWVHPYTRTLYWSDRDPSSAGCAELRAKSVPIDAVRVVTDDNPMPPGLHRKSLIIMSPSRAVKFTAITGQRHETWFNSLSYLLLRTEDDNTEDIAQDIKGPITHEASEFENDHDSHHQIGIASSTNGRTTRNETHERTMPTSSSRSSRMSAGALLRLSSYWRPGRESLIETISSRHSKHSLENPEMLIATSQAHDSAEDLREIIESQDRESDKLENVRACCDGRHDVGNLNSSIMSRHSRIAEVAAGCTRSESGHLRHEPRAR